MRGIVTNDHTHTHTHTHTRARVTKRSQRTRLVPDVKLVVSGGKADEGIYFFRISRLTRRRRAQPRPAHNRKHQVQIRNQMSYEHVSIDETSLKSL